MRWRARHQDRRIAGPPRSHAYRDVRSGDLARDLDHLADGVAVPAAAEVVDGASLGEDRERGHVRSRQIDHVHVVADAVPSGVG